jgi:hypothetical protein
MCLSIIDKYIKRPNYLSNIILIEFFVANYDIVNLKGKREKNHIMCYVHYNEHWTQKITREQLLLIIPFFDNEHTFKDDHSTWNATYSMHEIQINLLRKTFIYNFDNNNAYTTN